MFIPAQVHTPLLTTGLRGAMDAETAELRAHLAVATEALRRAEERATAGQFALEMLHEIRNPLEALGYLIHLATEDAAEAEKVREYLRLAEEQMGLLRHVASETLGIARVSASSQPIDFVAVADAALRIHHRVMRSKKIKLVRDCPERAVAHGYRGEMLQAISNLIVNALESMENEGTIYLRLRKHKDNVQLTIADNGHGISKEHMALIFEPFFTTKGERGNGLGLALTKKIIDHHSGRIRVKSSVRPNRSGTTFRISLPAS